MVLPIQRNHTISAGEVHSLAIENDGSIVQWGNTTYRHPTGTGFVAVSAGYYDSIALKKDGSIVQWGGTDSNQAKNKPTGKGFVAIAAGAAHALALKNDGSIVQWGYTGHDMSKGLNNVQKEKDYVAISAGQFHSIAIKEDGSIVQWGTTYDGQANGFDNIQKEEDYVAISAGRDHNLALKEDGSIVQWGNIRHDQTKNKPQGKGFVAIAAGYRRSLALKEDGSIVQWGNTVGGVTSGLNIIQAEKDYVAIAIGNSHSIALKNNGSLVQWGDTNYNMTTGFNNIQYQNFMIPNERRRRLPKNSSNNYKNILKNRQLYVPEKFKNFENKLKKKNNAERRKIILQRTIFLNNTKNAGNLVHRQALYNTSNLMTQELIKKILNATKVSAAVKKKYINHYKGPLSLKMIQNFKLNSENTLKLLTDKRVVKTNLLKNVMNSNMNKNVKLGFVKKTMTKHGMNKTLIALNKINKVDANFTDPVTYNQGNQVLMNNMLINNAGKLKIREAWAKKTLTGWNPNQNTHPMTLATGWRKLKNSARTTKLKAPIALTNMPNKPTGKRAIRATSKSKTTSRRKSK